MHKESKLLKVIIIAIIIVLAVWIILNFTYYKKCNTKECFKTELAKCNRAKFINQDEQATWIYFIKSSTRENCVVYVKNLKINIDETKKIEGKGMLCYLPRGYATETPQNDIDLCHGELKEALQDLIIQKMHLYIVQNIGKISDELKTPI